MLVGSLRPSQAEMPPGSEVLAGCWGMFSSSLMPQAIPLAKDRLGHTDAEECNVPVSGKGGKCTSCLFTVCC